MFEIIVLILFLLTMYAVLKKEKNAIRFIIIAYFTLLSIVFLVGINRISFTYNLYDGPLEGGFESLGNWVGAFGLLFILPTMLIFVYLLFKRIMKKFKETWVRISVYIVSLVVLMALSYVSLFIFTLLFYGFAP